MGTASGWHATCLLSTLLWQWSFQEQETKKTDLRNGRRGLSRNANPGMKKSITRMTLLCMLLQTVAPVFFFFFFFI